MLARDRKLALWIFLVVPIFVANFLVGLGTDLRRRGAEDFNQLYVGAKLVFTGRLYDEPSVLRLERETIGVEKHDVVPTRLPFDYVLMWPLARLPYGVAHTLWTALLICAAAGFVLLYPTKRRGELAAATCLSLPLAAGAIGIGQDVAVLLLVIAISLRLRAEGREVFAGSALALLLIKFHLFLLIPVVLALRREFRMLAGLCAGAVLLLAISFSAGPDWPRQYLEVISRPAISPGTVGMPNLHGLVSELPHAGAIEAALSLGVTGLTVACCFGAGLEAAFTAGLLGSFLLSRHSYLHDCAILIPTVVWMFSTKSKMLKVLAVLLATPFIYFLPPLLMRIREGTLPALAIIAALAAVASVAAEGYGSRRYPESSTEAIQA